MFVLQRWLRVRWQRLTKLVCVHQVNIHVHNDKQTVIPVFEAVGDGGCRDSGCQVALQ